MPERPLSFGVLGAVQVRIDARGVAIGAPRQRALLAQLLIDANRTVSSSRLIDGIWGETPPQHPESALQVVVCRLRRALDAVASRLVRDAFGYKIEVAPHELDLMLARGYVADARRAMEAGDARQAASDLDAALACWSGEPLADVANFPFQAAAARRLREWQLGVVESRNAAYLHCGRHLDVLTDIESWIEPNPWRERLRAHQMVALYRSGRQIEALAAYEDLRRLLVTDFGVDPHADLQRLQGCILRRDPTLLADRQAMLDQRDVVIVEDDSLDAGRTPRRVVAADALAASGP